MKKLTVKDILEIKGKKKITITTAHDYYTAKAAEYAGIDIIITSGGFIRTLVKGNNLTKNETLKEGLIALEGVRRGAVNTFIVAGLPYGYPFISNDVALNSAVKFLKNGADAIHVSGIELGTIKNLTKERIPCFGHTGLIPYHSTWFGGLRSVGKTAREAIDVYKNALALQGAGVFTIELECVPINIAKEITKLLRIPVIGIGSGPECDGQYLFSCDILGSHDGHFPRHAKKYINIYSDTINAFTQFKNDVENRKFPMENNNIKMDDKEFLKFKKDLEELSK